MESDRPIKPRLEDYGDMSDPGEALCPGCGSPLIGSEHGTLRVVRKSRESYGKLVLAYGTDGSFRVMVDPSSVLERDSTGEAAVCGACGQWIDAAIEWVEG